MTKEHGVTIKDNGPGDPMQSHDLFEVQFGHISGIIGFIARDEVGHLGEMVHQNKDGVLVPLGSGKI